MGEERGQIRRRKGLRTTQGGRRQRQRKHQKWDELSSLTQMWERREDVVATGKSPAGRGQGCGPQGLLSGGHGAVGDVAVGVLPYTFVWFGWRLGVCHCTLGFSPPVAASRGYFSSCGAGATPLLRGFLVADHGFRCSSSIVAAKVFVVHKGIFLDQDRTRGPLRCVDSWITGPRGSPFIYPWPTWHQLQ